MQAVKSLKKQAEKAKKKQDTAARQADLKSKLGEMNEEERAVWAARRKEVRQVPFLVASIPPYHTTAWTEAARQHISSLHATPGSVRHAAICRVKLVNLAQT